MVTVDKGIIDTLCALALLLLLAVSAQSLQAAEPTDATPTASGTTAGTEGTAPGRGPDKADNKLPNCDPATFRKGLDQSGFNEAEIRRIRQQLQNAGYPPQGIDGIIDPGTLKALAQLCEDLQTAAAEQAGATSTGSGPTADTAVAAADSGADKVGDQADNELPICDPASIRKSFKRPDFNKAKIKRIQQQLQDVGYPPQGIDGIVGPNTSKALARLCEDFQIESAENIPDGLLTILEEMSQKFLPSRSYIASDLFKQRLEQKSGDELIPELNPIQLSGNGCGCSREFSSLVYGFYPYWMASGEEQIVDFSLYDRIGYAMLMLDAQDDIKHQHRLQRRNEFNIADFINRAHKYRVKVDITLYASGWQGWSEHAIRNAIYNIIQTADEKFHSKNVNWLRKWLPLVRDNSMVSADGVNLFFDNYADHADSNNNLADIINGVVDELKDAGSTAQLNIMLRPVGDNIDKLFKEKPDDPAKKSCRQPASLECILLNERIEHVFVFLPQDTSHSKKLLRQAIENAYHGEERRTVLKKILPVIEPQGDAEKTAQFEDDLIYFKYSFAGVGLWPLPLAALDEDAAAVLQEKLPRLYQDKNSAKPLSDTLELCQYVCPNRWLFRIAFDLLAGLLVLYALLAWWNCRLRDFFQRYFLFFIAVCLLTALVFLVSLLCDPFWQQQAQRIGIGLLLVTFIGFIWRSVRKAMQPPLP